MNDMNIGGTTADCRGDRRADCPPLDDLEAGPR